jgi:hypothetical protein
MIDIKPNENIAIVVVGYNRLSSIKRLLGSLLNAHYSVLNVPLFISIDCSGDEALYDYVRKFEWPFGDKYVNIQAVRLGLMNHIFQCGDLTNHFKAVILLEDDIFVSPYFYDYALQAYEFYKDDSRVAGISLFKDEVLGRLPIIHSCGGSDSYLSQNVATWGEMWTTNMWSDFKSWFNNPENQDLKNVDMPEYIKGWKKAWSKYQFAYMVQTDRFYVYPSVSLTTCFADAGTNSPLSSCLGQVTLLDGPKEFHFRPFEETTKYDVYSTNLAIYEWLQIKPEELCVDLRNQNINRFNKRYLLTPYVKPYKVVKTFGLQLRPIELNVKFKIPGTELFLYDTKEQLGNGRTDNYPPAIPFYYLRMFDVTMLRRYLNTYYPNDIITRIKNKFFKKKR